jgi:hypothetical protein
MNRTRNTINRILAIPADVDAMPVNPNTAAISAIIKKVKAQPSIEYLLFCKVNFSVR